MCRELLKSSNEPLSTRALCDAAGGYFCAGEAHCYTLDSASLEKWVMLEIAVLLPICQQ